MNTDPPQGADISYGDFARCRKCHYDWPTWDGAMSRDWKKCQRCDNEDPTFPKPGCIAMPEGCLLVFEEVET